MYTKQKTSLVSTSDDDKEDAKEDDKEDDKEDPKTGLYEWITTMLYTCFVL